MSEAQAKNANAGVLALDMGHDDYRDVIAKFDDTRVCLHVSGNSYALQGLRADGRWETAATYTSGARLVGELMVDHLIELMLACEHLPEYARDASSLMRAGLPVLPEGALDAAILAAREEAEAFQAAAAKRRAAVG